MQTIRARLPATFPKLRAIRGLLDAVAEAVGEDPAELKSRPAFLRACDRLAADAREPGLPRLVAVKDGRKTVAYAPKSREDAVAIACGAAARKTMDVLVEGPLAARKTCGLRPSAPRPWHRDPDRAAELASAAAAFEAEWSPRMVAGTDGWRAALVLPYNGGGCSLPVERWITVIVFLRGTDRAPCLVQCRWQGALPPGDAGDPAARAAVEEALASGRPAAYAESSWTEATMDGLSRLLGEKGLDPYGRDKAFAYRMVRRHEFALRAACAAFRRAIPEVVAEHAGLCKAFPDPAAIVRFFSVRSSWTDADYRRSNQALRVLPCLRESIARDKVSVPVRKGEPIAAALGGLAGGGPARQKTVRSFAGWWRFPVQEHRTARMVRVLDELFRVDPHARVLTPYEMANLAVLVAKIDAEGRHRVPLSVFPEAIRAMRRDGSLKRIPRDLDHVLRWMTDECSAHLGYGADGAEAAEAACRIVFAAGRTPRGVAEAHAKWHREVQGFEEARRAFHAAVREELRKPEEEPSALYPHFMDAPREIDGVTLEPLADDARIVAEGRDLDHCVAGYSWMAAGGECLLVGLSSSAGRSTAELQIEEEQDGPVLRVVQHRGVGNGEPPPGHAAALRILLKDAADGVAVLKSLVAAASAEAASRGRWFDMTPQQARDFAELRFKQLAGFFSGPWKRLSREEWIATVRHGEHQRHAA